MITVYLTRVGDSPYWSAQWVIPGTRRRKTRSLRTTDPDRADRLRADLEYELNHGLADGRPRMAWADFVAKYESEKLCDLKSYTPQKVRGILDRFGAHARPLGVADVSGEMISAYARSLRQAGLKAPTIQTHLAHVRAALRWAARLGLIRHAPHVEPIKVVRRQRLRTLPADRLPALLDLMPDDAWRLLALVAWHTGMRRGELFALRWNESDDAPWLDLEAGRVRFPPDANKGGREDWLPLHPELMARLAGGGGEGRVFDLKKCGTVERLSKLFNDLTRPLGVRLHDLRRSFGTRYAPHVPAHVLQRLMRHADIRTTLEYYADLDPTLEEAIKKC